MPYRAVPSNADFNDCLANRDAAGDRAGLRIAQSLLIEALLILIAFFPYDCGIKPENADRPGVARGVLSSEPSD